MSTVQPSRLSLVACVHSARYLLSLMVMHASDAGMASTTGASCQRQSAVAVMRVVAALLGASDESTSGARHRVLLRQAPPRAILAARQPAAAASSPRTAQPRSVAAQARDACATCRSRAAGIPSSNWSRPPHSLTQEHTRTHTRTHARTHARTQRAAWGGVPSVARRQRSLGLGRLSSSSGLAQTEAQLAPGVDGLLRHNPQAIEAFSSGLGCRPVLQRAIGGACLRQHSGSEDGRDRGGCSWKRVGMREWFAGP
jgi:hypothetical protein